MSTTPPERLATAAGAASLEVRLLGPVDFDSSLQLQERIVFDLSGRTDRRGVLLLCEHPPLITIGREGARGQVLAGDDELASAGVPLRWVSRSGGATLHVPGQLAAYLLAPLDRLGLSLIDYRRRLEGALLEVCHELRVPAKQPPGGSGLWSRGGQVGQFGAAVRSWVSLHGAWLNVAPDPGWLRLMQSDAVWQAAPRGGGRARGGDAGMANVANAARPMSAAPVAVVEQRVTSLQEQLRRRVSMTAAREAAARRIAAAFGFEQVHTFTGHPALTRRRQQVCQRV